MADEVELDDHDKQRIESIIQEEQAIDSRIAQIQLRIFQLENQKEQLLQAKSQLVQSKQEKFNDMAARHDLDTDESYQYEDGKMKAMQQDQQMMDGEGIDLSDIDS